MEEKDVLNNEEVIVSEDNEIIDAEDTGKEEIVLENPEEKDAVNYYYLTPDELRHEVSSLDKDKKTIFILMIANAGSFLALLLGGALCLTPLAGIGLPIYFIALIAGIALSVVGIILSIKLVKRSQAFSDPNHYLNDEELKHVKDMNTLIIVAFISFILLFI